MMAVSGAATLLLAATASVVTGAVLFMISQGLRRAGIKDAALYRFFHFSGVIQITVFAGILLVFYPQNHLGFSMLHAGIPILRPVTGSISSLIVFLYLSVAGLKFTGFFSEYYKWKQITREADPQIPAAWLQKLQSSAAIQKFRKIPPVLLSARIWSPVSAGFLKPVIFFPMASVNRLSCDEFEMIVLHELAHYRLKHRFGQLIAMMTECILWFNPFALYFAKAARTLQEKQADDFVMGEKYSPLAYALSLQKLGNAPGLSATAIGFGSGEKGELLQRVRCILHPGSGIHFGKPRGLTHLLFLPLFLLLLLLKPEIQMELRALVPAKEHELSLPIPPHNPIPEPVAVKPMENWKEPVVAVVNNPAPEPPVLAEVEVEMKKLKSRINEISQFEEDYLENLQSIYRGPQHLASYPESLDYLWAQQARPDTAMTELLMLVSPEMVVEKLQERRKDLEAEIRLLEFSKAHALQDSLLKTKARRIAL